jgi:hypothetical protein
LMPETKKRLEKSVLTIKEAIKKLGE